LAKNFRAKGSAFGSTNAMVARSLIIHDGMSMMAHRRHLGIISRQKVYVCYHSYEYVYKFGSMNSKIGWHARASLVARRRVSFSSFLTMAISQHLKSVSFTTYRLNKVQSYIMVGTFSEDCCVRIRETSEND
jgi:hypothetical protein